MVIACLDYDGDRGYGRRCHRFATKGKPGYSVLKTALLLNNAILKGEGLCPEQNQDSCIVSWNTKGVKNSTAFCLGDHGTLKVLRRLKHSPILEVEWKPVLSETVQEIKNVARNEMILGRGVQRHHQEYIQGVSLSMPLRILVLSGSMEPIFSKHI